MEETDKRAGQEPELNSTPIPADTDAPSVASGDAGTRRRALLVVVLAMFIDLLGFGIVLPLLPRFGEEFLDPLLRQGSWLSPAAEGAILGLLVASFSLMQFIFAPIWGRLSDLRGRRPFLLLGLAGSVAFYALFGVASELGASGNPGLGIVLLFVSRMGAGIAGATVSTAQAVIADTTTPEKRSRGMALIGLGFGVGFTFGPAIGFGAVSFLPAVRGAPGFVAAGLSFIALVLAIVLMPETFRPGRSAERRKWFNWSGLQTALQTPTVGTLILMFFLATVAFSNFEPTLALLTKDALCYGDRRNFLVFMYVGFVLALTQGGLYQFLAKRGIQELEFVASGTILMAVGLGGLGVLAWLASAPGRQPSDVTNGYLTSFFITVTVAIAGFAFVIPSVQALISRRSAATRQGQVLGVNQSVNALSRILGPFAGVLLYKASPEHTLPYVFAVILLAAVIGLIPQVRQAPRLEASADNAADPDAASRQRDVLELE
jgi:MFS family permease